MGLRETNYFRPSGAGRARGAGRQDCGLISLLTAEFSHDLILTHSLEFSQSKPRLLAVGSCNKIPSHRIFKKKQLGVSSPIVPGLLHEPMPDAPEACFALVVVKH